MARRGLPIPHLLLRLAWHVRLRLLRATGWPTRGVKAMLFDRAGRVLLIRNSYGRRHLWVFPGGGMGRSEAPEQAVRREVREELGCGIADLRYLSTHLSTSEGKRDTIHLYAGRAASPPAADRVEVAEARFFPLDALPENVSDATLRRIEEYRRGAAPDSGW